jgi:hypothetical protein
MRNLHGSDSSVNEDSIIIGHGAVSVELVDFFDAEMEKDNSAETSVTL